LAGETEVLGENLPSAALSTTNPTCCPDAIPGSRVGKPAINRLSYGTAQTKFNFHKKKFLLSTNFPWIITLYCVIDKNINSTFILDRYKKKITMVISYAKAYIFLEEYLALCCLVLFLHNFTLSLQFSLLSHSERQKNMSCHSMLHFIEAYSSLT
jgi:hypothetical protein